jgi:hypothetical protein
MLVLESAKKPRKYFLGFLKILKGILRNVLGR